MYMGEEDENTNVDDMVTSRTRTFNRINIQLNRTYIQYRINRINIQDNGTVTQDVNRIRAGKTATRAFHDLELKLKKKKTKHIQQHSTEHHPIWKGWSITDTIRNKNSNS